MKFRAEQLRTLSSLLPRSEPVRLRRTWDESVGPRIAAKSDALRIRGTTLVVQAASAAWAQELSLLSSVILDRLAKAGLPVDALRFQVGVISREKSLKLKRAVVRRATLPNDLRGHIDGLDDSELGDSIKKAAELALGRVQGRRRRRV